jgi:hypothetical protein
MWRRRNSLFSFIGSLGSMKRSSYDSFKYRANVDHRKISSSRPNTNLSLYKPVLPQNIPQLQNTKIRMYTVPWLKHTGPQNILTRRLFTESHGRFCWEAVTVGNKENPPLWKLSALIKKKRKFSSYIRKFRRDRLQSHIRLTTSSYMVKSSYTVLVSPSSYMTFQPIPS